MTEPKYPTDWKRIKSSKRFKPKRRVVVTEMGGVYVEQENGYERFLARGRKEVKLHWDALEYTLSREVRGFLKRRIDAFLLLRADIEGVVYDLLYDKEHK